VRSNKTGLVGVQPPLRRSDYVILLVFLAVIGFIAYGTVSRLSDVPDVGYPAVAR
jgi:hypothetical protein